MIFSIFAVIIWLHVALATTIPLGYGPKTVVCPINTTTLIREARGLSSEEQNFLTIRSNVTRANLQGFLKNVAKLNTSEYSPYLQNDTIKIAIALSGGSYRAMLTGAGQLAAFDSKTINATKHGLGGLLQSATYLAGTSGGNWLVGSLSVNNWTSVQNVISGQKIWDLKYPVYDLKGLHLFKTYKIWKSMLSEMKEKKKAGYRVSLTDLWGIALSRQLLSKSSTYGSTSTWSGIAETNAFKTGQMPFIISVSNAMYGTDTLAYYNSTVVEMNPFELGSWEKTANTFVQTKYIGTKLINGKPLGEASCVNGYDNAGFIMGTSSSIFVVMIDELKEKIQKIKFLYALVSKMFDKIIQKDLDQAIFDPSPFYKTTYGYDQQFTQASSLTLVDGGSDGQNIPLVPLLQKQRSVDVIFALDSSENRRNYFPNGSSLIRTYERLFYRIGSGISFPKVPLSPEEFEARNFTKEPTFFGCNSNITSSFSPPVIVYLPNKKISYASNTSTYKMSYSDKEKFAMIKNGFEIASRNNMTDDPQWATCVGCAIVRRSQQRLGQIVSHTCQQCFKQYCYS